METSTLMESTTERPYTYYKWYNEGPNAENRPMDFPILSTVIILSLAGNILVVVVSACCMRLRSLTSIFILNLALSDLLFTVGLVFLACDDIWGLTPRDAECKAIYCAFSAGFCSSVVFMLLLSVQRYITVVHPHTDWKKRRCFTHVLVCAWIVTILAALPVTVHIVALPESGGCGYNSKTASAAVAYEENLIFVCAFLFMFYYYIRIFKSPTNQRHRTTGLAFFLVATFFIFWAPHSIMIFLDTLPYDQIRFLTQDLEHFYYIGYICHLLAVTRCCLNPVIYGLFGIIFHKTAREIFQRRGNFNPAPMRV